jgi:hypothetical protein
LEPTDIGVVEAAVPLSTQAILQEQAEQVAVDVVDMVVPLQDYK